ncbi:serine-rich adhesin for platelets-like isoform X2 [Centroberyx affinis]|uniref:serine-rich adhesin for platelets-like isoform X2 n=1 Tax=Centroberyx affinis TaxID=166261 RepID=UPI003A5C2139
MKCEYIWSDITSCVSAPQIDQQNLKKSSASPRLDDIHAYHRGRRQSEPPELLMFTPDRSRKSLPLLLEGNLPYRRTRRQSAPAKDIEAAFHPNGNPVALKQAGSEGELCPDSLGSAGSSSTLASSVIEVEADRTERGRTPGPGPGPGPGQEEEEEEEEEDELPPLSPPPTLSITEEILQFINQSRAREGLTRTEQTLDQPKQSPPPSNQTNFTCPLPPVACPPSPEQGPTVQQEQDGAKMEDDSPLQSQTGGSREEEESLENERTTNGVQETLDETVQVEKGEEKDRETETEGMESREGKEEERRNEGDRESTISTPIPLSSPLLTSNLHPSIPAEKEREQDGSSDAPTVEGTAEAASPPRPELLHRPVQSPPPPKRGSHLTKSDKKIIEKIRSYYEAAAEAGDEEEQEEGQGGGEEEVAASRRRNSFSQIPSGLVKESVSRFDVCGHQGEPESGRSECGIVETMNREVDREVTPSSPATPTSPSLLSVDGQNDGQADKSISSMDGETEGQTSPVKSTTSTIMQGSENENQVGQNLQSNPSRPVGEEVEILDKSEEVCMEEVKEREKEGCEEREEGKTATGAEVGTPPLRTKQEEGKSIAKEDKHRDETAKTSTRNQPVVNGHGPTHTGPAEPKGSHKEPAIALPPTTNQCQKIETKTQSSCTRTKSKDLANPSGNLEGLPSQIKVGRWSRHSRIVSANRALFEGTGPDVAGIGLFEAGPVVDPALMENSERILSKVQTLAQMYSAKASTMKVPLHQKRGCAGRTQTWASARLDAPTPNQIKSQTQVQYQTQTQTQTKYWQQTPYENQASKMVTNKQAKTVTETKLYQSQTRAEAKHQSKTYTQTKYETQTQTRQQTQIQSKNQTRSQTQTQYQSQTQTKAYSQYQTHTTSQYQHQDDQRIQEEEKKEERMINRAESLTNDFQETAMVPCEPLLFGHVFVREQLSPPCHHQMTGYTLSRPRDFISALSQERDSLTSTLPRGNLSTSLRGQFSSPSQDKSYNPGDACVDTHLTSTPSRDHLNTLPEDQSSNLGCSSSDSPLMSSMDHGSSLFRKCCPTLPTDRGLKLAYSSTNSPLPSRTSNHSHAALQRPEEKAGGEEEAEEVVNHNGEVHSDTEETEKREGPDLDVGRPLYSIREDSTSVSIVTQSAHCGPNLSAHNGLEWMISGDEQDNYMQDIQDAQDLQDIQFVQDMQDIQGPEYKFSTGLGDGEANSGEVVLMVVSTQTQAPTENQSSMVLDPGLPGDEAQREAPYLGEGGGTAPGVSGGPKKVEPQKEEMKWNGTEGNEVESLSQTKMSLQGSTLIFSEEPRNYESSGASALPQPPTQSPHMTYDLPVAGQTVTEVREGVVSSPWSSVRSPDPNPTSSRPLSVQSMDCLPTFTSQRPADLPAAMGKRALSNAWNANNTTPYDHSSRDPDHQDPGSLSALPSSGHSSGGRPSSRPSSERPNPAISTPGQAADLAPPPSAFRPSLRRRSPSPGPAFPTFAVRAPPCSSPFRAVPASSPTPSSTGGFTSPTAVSRSLPCFSPTPSSGRSSSVRAAPPSSPTPSSSSSGRSSSIRAAPPSSPTPSSSLRAPPPSSPTPSSSAFTRSLAASCISQSITQSMAKKNATRQQAPPLTTGNQGPSSSSSLPSSQLRLRSPSPKFPPSQQGSSTPAFAQLGCTKDGYQHPRCPPASLRSSCPSPSPSPVQSPPPYRSQRSASPSMSHQPLPSSTSSPSPSFLHSKSVPASDSSRCDANICNSNNNNNNSNNNNNNNNNNVNGSLASYAAATNGNLVNGSWSVSQQKAPLANGSANATAAQQSHDPLWSGSHNRVARPFSASEPSSRVQSPSPSPSPSPGSFSRLCSPPPQHNYTSPMANKPPHPRSTRVGGASPHNPLGLTLELPRASSASSAAGPSSSCLSPRILSPPPIGVSVNVWTNNVATPQPRNPRPISYSPSPSISSSLASPTLENTSSSFPSYSSSSVPLRGSRASSPSASCAPASSSCSQTTSQNLRRSRGSSLSSSSSLVDRPPSPARSNPSGLRRSWAESSRRSLGFGGSGGGSFDLQESGLTSPRGGWSSYGGSPSCLSPRAGLQSPFSPGRLTPGRGTLGGQHFTSVPWPDVQELLTKYADSPDRSPTSTFTASSPSLSLSSHTFLSSPAPLSSPSGAQTEWGDPEPEEGNCRSQLICAYVARPSVAQNLPSSCLVFSSSGMTSPPPPHYQHQNYQPQVKPQPLVQNSTTAPLSSTPSPLPSGPSPLPSTHSTPTKPGNQKTSYATTVNLQIAGSGRITSFSTAQVSLTQTLQAGAGVGPGGPGQGQGARRVSINGLSHLPPPSPIPQNCKRL